MKMTEKLRARFEKNVVRRPAPVSFVMHGGYIAPGQWVLHSCDNPECTNPLFMLHLLVADMVKRRRMLSERYLASRPRGAEHWRRQRPEDVPRGSAHGMAKIDECAVRSIRERVANGETQTALAREFGMTQGAIGHIVRRMNWAHVI